MLIPRDLWGVTEGSSVCFTQCLDSCPNVFTVILKLTTNPEQTIYIDIIHIIPW